MRSAQKKRRRMLALMLALSCIVSGNVYWQLRSIGIAMSGQAGCAEDPKFCEQTDVPVSSGTIAAETALAIAETETELLSAVAVDITFRAADGTELEPADGSDIEVRIMLPETLHLPEGEYAVHHQKADGSVEEITDADLSAQAACFSADSFSIYVLTATGMRDKDVLHESLDEFGGWLIGDGDGYFHNNEYKPYILKKGDKITIVTKSRATETGLGYPFASNDRILLTHVKDDLVTEDAPRCHFYNCKNLSFLAHNHHYDLHFKPAYELTDRVFNKAARRTVK